MNKSMTSLLAIGIGAAAYSLSRGNNNLLNARTMKRMRKRITRAIF